MNNNGIMTLINESFQEEPQMFELAMYAVSRLNLTDALMRSVLTLDTEVKNIPPESLELVLRYENGLTMNKFYQEYFGPIKTVLTIDEVKLNTLVKYLDIGEKKDNILFMKSAKALMLTRFDVLTTIAFLWKGMDFAEEFDLKLRVQVQLPSEYEKFFEERGV